MSGEPKRYDVITVVDKGGKDWTGERPARTLANSPPENIRCAACGVSEEEAAWHQAVLERRGHDTKTVEHDEANARFVT